MDEVATHFRADTGLDARLVFGSSGNLARQPNRVPLPAPMSADEGFVLRLVERGAARDPGTLYAEGRIVVFAPPGSPIRVNEHLDGLRTALEAGRIEHFAIVNPGHAPHGRAAEEALRSAGLWDQVQPRLVLGENIAQAMQSATAAGAQGGIIALSLARAPQSQGRGTWALLPSAWHKPLLQRMALLRPAGAAAERFYAYMQSPPAREKLRRYGFVLPGGSLIGVVDWTALRLSLLLGAATLLLLLPPPRCLARSGAGRGPGCPTVGAAAHSGRLCAPAPVRDRLAPGPGCRHSIGSPAHLLVRGAAARLHPGQRAFAVQPVQNAFAAIPQAVREAAAVSGMSPIRALLRVELPLAWPGIAVAAALTFTHTLGEFGVVLMVGGSIPSVTRTATIALYDRVQAFDDRGAALLASALLAVSLVALLLSNMFSRQVGRRTRHA